MNCPACQAVNPAQARFCLHCGVAFVQGITCRACFTLLPLHARYCYTCGTMTVPNQATFQAQVGGAPPPVTYQPPAAQPPPTAVPQPVPPTPAQPPAAAPAETAVTEEVEKAATEAATAVAPPAPPAEFDFTLPPARPISDLLPSLQKYLTKNLFDPLERRPNERNLIEARDHMAQVLGTAKTYLPRPVVMNPQPAGVPAGGMFQGVFLFVDVSGFTPLSEMLSQFEDGAEQVTYIINSLFVELVQVLFNHGGVLLKFGGDALLGLFEGANESEMKEGARRATQAAMKMQQIMLEERFANIRAGNEQMALRVKCGISSGPYFAAHIGTAENMGFVTTGHTVNQAEQAEGHAEPGDVVMTQSIFDLLAGQAETEERPENHHLVKSIPPAGDALQYIPVAEPPEGPVEAQITYLVDRLNRLAPYMASELMPRLVNSPDPANVVIAPERRPVTIMFANYKGISDLIEDMGETQPELITQQLNRYFVHMAEIVEKYEGTLARMDQYAVGDRLVIFFGAPRAHEDDPERAIRTALEMQKAVRANFSALQTAEGIYRFQQRIGINTGHLFAGNAGATNLRQEYTLMGDDINTAARLMSKAKWQTIFISKKAKVHVDHTFELKDLGEMKFKGKSIRIPTFQVIGQLDQAGSARGLGGESPYVGREDELDKLIACGEGLRNGRGQIVSIIGDSGRGKSRLNRELYKWVQEEVGEEEIHWIETRALSFTEQVSNWMSTQMIQNALGLGLDANQDDVLFTLWDMGEELLGKETAREAIPFIAALFDLPLEGEWAKWVKELDPQVRQKQTFWAIREFFIAYARQKPTIITLDDLHWADEASLALFADLLSVTDEVPLMFCLIFRQRRDKGCWQLRNKADSAYAHRYTEITINPLTSEASQELLQKLLPGAEFSSRTLRDILDKSAGNPFYLEEVVRSLIDNEGVVKDPDNEALWIVTDNIEKVDVPDTLQGALVARIDRLTEDSRQALQMASVIGRQFQALIFRNLAGKVREIDAWLAQLERANLIHPIHQAEDPRYSFPDALVQEVAYESLLVQRRRDLHRRVGEALEARFGDRLEQESETLAYHFENSDDQEKAMIYMAMAAQKAQENYANETALERYDKLIILYIEAGRSWQEVFELLANRQKIFKLIGRNEEREKDLREMYALAKDNGHQDGMGDALNGLADYFQWASQYDQAQKAATEALKIKQKTGDKKGEAEARQQLGVFHYVRGNYSEAEPLLTEAQALNQTVENRDGEGWSTMYLGMIHFRTGNYGAASQYHEEAMELARSRQDWFQMGIHLTNAALVDVRLGQYQPALEKFEKSQEMRYRVGDKMGQGFTLFGMGQAHTYLDDYEEAMTHLEASLALREQLDDQRGISFCYNCMGLVALAQEDYAPAEEYFQQAYEIRTKLGLKTEQITDLTCLSQAKLQQNDLAGAAEASNQALQLLEQQKGVEEVQQVYLNHFRVLAAQEDADAGDWLQKAYDAMMEQANAIQDPEARQGFLQNVRVNQAIMAEVESGQWTVTT